MKTITPLHQLTAVILLLCSFAFNLKAQQIYINEFLASNSNVNTDEFGEDDDWVELYNASSSIINLDGMFLTDDLTNTAKWIFPSGTSIPANGFLLVWCDNQDSQGALHTSFKLGSGGEDLAIVAADGTTIIDSYTFGSQTANVSQGRQSDGSTPWVFFGTPSPEATNGGSSSTVASMPIASQNGGHYSSDITVTLTTPTTGGTIRYTVDGSEPINSSSSYSSPLNIDETTVLRARTFKSGMNASRTMTHTYLYGINHTLPIFCVSTNDDNFFGDEDGIYTNWDDDIEQPAHVELYEADGSFGFRQDLGVQVHGGFSQSYPHKGISFIAKNEYGNNKINYPLFPTLPFDEYGSFILRASGNDWSKTLFRDALASGLAREFDDIKPLIKDPDLEFQAYRPAVVYLNGEYFGIHNLREKLDWRYLKTHYGIEKGEADMVEKKNDLEHGNLDAWENYFDFIEDADFTDPEDYAELKTWLDMDHFVDYFLINIFVDNNDWPDNNNKRWRLRQDSSKWRYFLYDMDRGFGIIPLSGDYNSGDWTSQSLEMVMAETQTESHNKEWSTLLLRKVMLNDDFRLKFINRMADQLNIMYTPERLIGRIDQFEGVYTPEIDQHADKWWDTNYYATNVNRARIFATNRTEEMWNQYDDFYNDISDVVDLEINAIPAAGGTVHVNTINLRENNFPWTGQYFAGVDVPLRVEPNPGYIFTGWTPTILGNNTTTTMNLNGDDEVTANFILGSTQIGAIVINEINYHSPDTCNAGDWIELFNAGDQAINISGWFLEDESGNYFNIPPNTNLPGQGYLVLVEDSLRFQNTHPAVTNFIGGFGNSITGNVGLSNGGEWISINNADRSFMDTVHYDDNLPWPVEADGQGPSLQLISPELDNALPESWIASQVTKGTPGLPQYGELYIGQNLILCTAENVTLDAIYSPCTNCTYNWSSGATTSAITFMPPVGTTTYTVTVTEAGGATQTDEVSIERSTPFNLSHTQQNLVCHEDSNGSIDLSVSSAGTFTYQWTNGSTTQDVINLPVGSFTVTVTDALLCTQTEEVIITAPPAIITSGNETEINCYGELGAIDVSISGGGIPYNYLWSNGATSQDLVNLEEGIYELTITDGNNCTAVKDFELNEPSEIIAEFDVEHDCDGEGDGNIDVDAFGGVGSYVYSWSNGVVETSDDLLDLEAGIYTLTITDDNGCTWTDATEVLSSADMSGNAVIINNSCSGGNSGSITLNTTGGVAPYDYDWSISGSSAQQEDLSTGEYMVTITDDIGCESSETYTISNSAFIDASAIITETTCFEGADGSITTNVTGGDGNYNYIWSTGSTAGSISNLTEGSYTLTITDSQGCSDSFVFQLDQPTSIAANEEINNIDCIGNQDGSIFLNTSGGSGSYTYLWSNGYTGPDPSNLAAGQYSVTITDSNNCNGEYTFTIAESSAIVVASNISNLFCFGNENGAIALTISGGAPDYEVEWSNGSTGSTVTNLSAGNYSASITDMSGCVTTEEFTVTEPDAITTTIESTDPQIGMGGSITLNPTGGVPPYSFQWNTGDNEATINDLEDGLYSYVITDSNGCFISGDVMLGAVGISTIPENAVHIYPNPTNGFINIESEFSEMDLTIIDVLGRRVYFDQRFDAQAIWTIDLNKLESGLYFIKIETKDGERTERILLENR